MNAFSISGIVIGMASLAMSAWVYLANKTSRANQCFAFYCIAVMIWGFGGALIGLSKDPDVAMILWRITHVGVIFIPVLLYHFVVLFLGLHRPKSVFLAYFIGTLFLAANATLYFIAHMRWVFGQFYYDSPPGVLYPYFVFFFFATVLVCHIDLWKFIRRSSGLQKLRVQWFFIAAAAGYSGGITCFLPVFGLDVYPYGNFTVPLYTVIMGYSVVRHQLLGIEVIVKRTLVFAGLVTAVVGVVSLVAVVSQDVLARFVEIPRWLSNVLAAGIIAGVYGPLRNWLTNATERYLFQKKYDYKELLRKFTDEAMMKVDLRDLLETTVKTLSETVKLEGCSLLLLNKDMRQYELAASRGTNGQHLVLDEREPFITFLRKTHEPIGQDGELGKVRFPAAVTDCLKHLNARLALPLHVHDDLIGVLCLGKKKSDEEFTKDDLDILLPLAKTLAIAVSNAQLFDELAKTQAEAAQREKLAVIGTLSAGINHEICNPLGIVKAQCEAFILDLQDGILVGKSQQEILDRTSAIMGVALKQIDRATAITQKLSNFAKPIKEPTTQPVAVPQEIDEVLLLVGYDLRLERIEVQKILQSDLPPIIVDRRQLQEVLFNLIRNAAQAITPPGMITIRAHPHEGGVRIEIEDTGSGIPPDKLGKIYDPFFTTKEPGKGTGLGLFIVRQIVERNKGRIAVESTVGKGTTFLLDFPAAAQPALA